MGKGFVVLHTETNEAVVKDAGFLERIIIPVL